MSRRYTLVFGLMLALYCGRALAEVAPSPVRAPSPVVSASPSPAASPSPSPSPTPFAFPSVGYLTPDEILGRTENSLRRNPNPPYITYVMRELFVHHGARHEYTYRVWYRSDGQGLMQNMGAGRRGKNETFFGYPFPSAPDNNILLYATPAPVVAPPPPVGNQGLPAGGSTPIPTLSQERVHGDRYYVVSLAGLENLQGHPLYHLTLRAVRDESKHPWKDLWVDMLTFQVWKAHADAAGSVGPLVGRAVADVDFAPVGPFWLVKRVIADGNGRFGFLSDSGHYEYYFSDFGFPTSVPDWYFDEKAFQKHR
ncbi:MAG: hypothetical protein ACR2KS_10985 [Candidatus Eremiobacter antarcticus]